VPLLGTSARILWDDRALYVAFEMEDRDVWARDAARDDPKLPGDEVVEVFVDPDGDEVTYYEFEWSPLGVAYDLFNYVPAPPSDFNPWAQFVGLADWDARDVECKVAVQGTLDRVADFESARAPATSCPRNNTDATNSGMPSIGVIQWADFPMSYSFHVG